MTAPASTEPAGQAPGRVVRARIATSLVFGFNGLLMAAWVPHIPEVKHHLGLSDATLGLALLGPAVGSVLSMPLIGRATTRWGSGPVTAVLAFATYLVIPGPGLAGNLAELFGALMLWGIATGGLDVAMNSQAVQIETSYRRPIMSSFHAYWSIGTVLGTVLGSLGAGIGLSLAGQQSGLAVLLALVTFWCRRQFVGDHPAQDYQAGKRVFEFRLVLLGLAGVCALLAEGSAGDWSPVYLRDDLHVSPGHAGIGFGAFTVMMTVGRLTGDRLVLALGRSRSLALLATIGAVGMSAGLIDNTVVGSSIGFGCLGAGPVGAGAGDLLHRRRRPGGGRAEAGAGVQLQLSGLPARTGVAGAAGQRHLGARRPLGAAHLRSPCRPAGRHRCPVDRPAVGPRPGQPCQPGRPPCQRSS